MQSSLQYSQDDASVGLMTQPVDDLVRSRLRAIRQHLGWSLDDLAAKTGVGASTISRIETGRRTISFDVLSADPSSPIAQ